MRRALNGDADTTAISDRRRRTGRSGRDALSARRPTYFSHITRALFRSPVAERHTPRGSATLTVASALGPVIERREIEFMRGSELEVGGRANGVYSVSIDAVAGPVAAAGFVIQR